MIKIIFFFLFLPSVSLAIVARVGNGNDGNDLEGFEKISSGKIYEAHKKAVSYIKSLNTHGLPALGQLLPELENNQFYMTKKNVSAQKLRELGAYEDSPEGLVYARTFSKAHSPTRFFPISLKLDQNQLIALHIHEALHRALPKDVKENEEVVTKVTLLLTAPGSSYDHIREELQKLHPVFQMTPQNSKFPTYKEQSSLYAQFDNFFDSKRKGSTNFSRPIKRRYLIGSEFYPFKEGADTLNLGLGVESSYLITEAENYIGPFSFKISAKLFNRNGVELKGAFILNFATDAQDGPGESLQGRDTKEFHLNLIKNRWKYQYRLLLAYMSSSSLSRNRDGQEYRYDVGSILTTKLEYMRNFSKIKVGALATLHSVEKFNLSSSSMVVNKGRNHFFALGPKLQYRLGNDVDLSLDGTYLFNYKKDDRDFDQFGDLLGQSLGQFKLSLGLIYKI